MTANQPSKKPSSKPVANGSRKVKGLSQSSTKGLGKIAPKNL